MYLDPLALSHLAGRFPQARVRSCDVCTAVCMSLEMPMVWAALPRTGLTCKRMAGVPLYCLDSFVLSRLARCFPPACGCSCCACVAVYVTLRMPIVLAGLPQSWPVTCYRCTDGRGTTVCLLDRLVLRTWRDAIPGHMCAHVTPMIRCTSCLRCLRC